MHNFDENVLFSSFSPHSLPHDLMQTVSKIVRFLGKSVTEKVFLQHFSRLCSDLSFHVRRACASNFGEICSVIGQDLTEAVLVSLTHAFHHIYPLISASVSAHSFTRLIDFIYFRFICYPSLFFRLFDHVLPTVCFPPFNPTVTHSFGSHCLLPH